MLLLQAGNGMAQGINTDSVLKVIENTSDEITKAKLYYLLSENSPTDSGIMYYAERTLEWAEKAGYKKGIAEALNNIGYVYTNRGDNVKALEMHNQSLKLAQEINDKEGIAITLNNIAYIYHNIGNIPQSIKYNERSLKIREEIGDEKGLAYSLNNIGNIYLDQEDYPKALDYFIKSLNLSKKRGDLRETALAYSNIGSIYDHQKDTAAAKESYRSCLSISESINWKYGIATAMNNLASIYKRQGQLDSAFAYYYKSLELYRQSGDKLQEAKLLNNISSCFHERRDFKNALIYGDSALSLSLRLGYPTNIRDASELLSRINALVGNYEKAYELQLLHKQMADSVRNDQTRDAMIKSQMQYEFDKVQAEQQSQIQKQKILRNTFILSFGALLVFFIVIYRQRNNISKSKKRSDELLLNILPVETAEELKAKGSAKAKYYESVTVMFADFKGFTNVSEQLTPEQLVEEINYCFSAFDNIIQKYEIEKIKTIGDAYMCAGGLPKKNNTHAIDIINAALEFLDFMKKHHEQKQSKNEISFELRIGVNSGPVVAGIVGVKKFAYDIWGDTVNVAARMESTSEPGKINISGTTYQLVSKHFNCEFRGKLNAKHKGEVEMYFIKDRVG